MTRGTFWTLWFVLVVALANLIFTVGDCVSGTYSHLTAINAGAAGAGLMQAWVIITIGHKEKT